MEHLPQHTSGTTCQCCSTGISTRAHALGARARRRILVPTSARTDTPLNARAHTTKKTRRTNAEKNTFKPSCRICSPPSMTPRLDETSPQMPRTHTHLGAFTILLAIGRQHHAGLPRLQTTHARSLVIVPIVCVCACVYVCVCVYRSRKCQRSIAEQPWDACSPAMSKVTA